MTLPQRLLLGSLVLVSLLVAAIVALSGSRLERRLVEETTSELTREARLIALLWKSGTSADALADSAGSALQRRVTLIDPSGVIRKVYVKVKPAAHSDEVLADLAVLQAKK